MNTKTNMSRRGIVNDLKESPFMKKIIYASNNYIVFFFSSKLYKEKFEERLEENRKKINESLSNRFGFKIENDVLCDIKLYINIEKRGFLLKNHKEGFECLRNIRLDGKRPTLND